MTIKLESRSQLEAVELLLRILIAENPATNPAERLVFDHVYNLYTKARSKVESLAAPRSGWSLNMTTFEALAFYVFYQNHHIPEMTYHYEALQLRMIFNQIDKEYGTVTGANRSIAGLASGSSQRTIGSPAR